jgi:hypothetical protein
MLYTPRQFSRFGLLGAILLALVCMAPIRAVADHTDDIEGARQCLDGALRHNDRNTLPCIRGILGYSDKQASILKCSIRTIDQGWNVFQFPSYVIQPGAREWVIVLNGISDRDLDVKTALIIQRDCHLAGDPVSTLMGDYYMLRARLLEITLIDVDSMALNLPGTTDAQTVQDISNLLDQIVAECKAFPATAVLPIKDMSWCHEALHLPDAPGRSSFEKLIATLYVGS